MTDLGLFIGRVLSQMGRTAHSCRRMSKNLPLKLNQTVVEKTARALVGLEITRPRMIMGSRSDGKHRWLVIRQQNAPWGIRFQPLRRSSGFFVQ